MPRPYRKGDQRKAELLAAARTLFIERGYDAVSLDDILAAADASKGAFYYYFDSKLAVLDALIEHMTSDIVAKLEPLCADTNLSALEKFYAISRAGLAVKVPNKELIKAYLCAIYRDENLQMRYRLDKAAATIVTPIYEKIIAQGLAEGSFHTPSPSFAARMIVAMSIGTRDQTWRLLVDIDSAPQNAQEIDRVIELFEHSMERILGAPEGSLNIVKLDDIKALRRDVPEAPSDRIANHTD